MQQFFSLIVPLFFLFFAFDAHSAGILQSQLHWDNDDTQNIKYGDTGHAWVIQTFDPITATSTLDKIIFRANDLSTVYSPYIYLCKGNYDGTATSTSPAQCYSGNGHYRQHDWDGTDWVDEGNGKVSLPGGSGHNHTDTELTPGNYWLLIGTTSGIEPEVILGTSTNFSGQAYKQGDWDGSEYAIQSLGANVDIFFELWTDEISDVEITFPEDGGYLPTGNYDIEGWCSTSGDTINMMWWSSEYNLCPPTIPTASYSTTCDEDNYFSLFDSNLSMPLLESATSTRVMAWTDDFTDAMWILDAGTCILLSTSPYADVINVTIDDDYYETLAPDSCSFTSGIIDYTRCQAWYMVNDFSEAIKTKFPFGYLVEWHDLWQSTATSTDDKFQLDLSDATPSTTITFFDIDDDLNSLATSTVEDVEFVVDVFFTVIGLFMILLLVIRIINKN